MQNMSLKETRKFGTIAFFFFGCLIGISYWRNHEILMWFFGILCTFGFLIILLPKQLSFLHKGWMAVGHFIGTTITTVLMSIAYYLVITPFGFLKMIFGGKPLPLKPDKNCNSYWIKRTEPAQPKERFIKRY